MICDSIIKTMEVHIMNKTIIKEIKTRAFADGDEVETILTLDFTNLTDDEVMDLAVKSAVINWQANARRAKVIPTKATYIVPRPGTRTSAVATPEALIRAFGGDVDKAIEALMNVKR